MTLYHPTFLFRGQFNQHFEAVFRILNFTSQISKVFVTQQMQAFCSPQNVGKMNPILLIFEAFKLTEFIKNALNHKINCEYVQKVQHETCIKISHIKMC